MLGGLAGCCCAACSGLRLVLLLLLTAPLAGSPTAAALVRAKDGMTDSGVACCAGSVHQHSALGGGTLEQGSSGCRLMVPVPWPVVSSSSRPWPVPRHYDARRLGAAKCVSCRRPQCLAPWASRPLQR
ncbi:hypothetical protein COO60DRAFT_1563156, partial [Scenedesmus sp. NREL 46B-D3]